MSIGEEAKPRRELNARTLSKIPLDCRADRVAARRDRLPISIHDGGVVATTSHCNVHRHTVEQNLRAVLPLAWTVLDEDAMAFAVNPALLPLDELLCFSSRAAARYGDAHRSVRAQAQDVASRAADSNEFDDLSWVFPGNRSRLTRLVLRERQVQLHKEKC